MSDTYHDKIAWTYCGKPILHEYADGSYELAEGVTEYEALDFCVKNIQAMRSEREQERRLRSAIATVVDRIWLTTPASQAEEKREEVGP